ncbi:MAG: ABC transporter substrate-binding protein [Actinobacteria bacterium]|nr:ABC transporter substrate-binding protein [Actinomycetota bacterium]
MSGASLRMVVPDLISNSYFPALAAVELGCLREEGIEAEVELLFPVDAAYQALAAGEVDVVAGSAHSALAAFPEWRGVKLLAAQGQGMYWFLVMRADLEAERGELAALRGCRIGAAPWVDLGLQQLLLDAGIDPEQEGIEIAPVPGAVGAGTNFGLTAAQALADGKVDGFWANGMAAELALRSGAGRLLLDVRRGDGPAGCFDYTFASLAAREDALAAEPERFAAVVRALRRAQALLAEDPERATAVVEGIFPPQCAELIAELVRRDVPLYEAAIGEAAVAGMNRFARERGLLDGDPAYEQVVATELAPLWNE